MKCFNYIVFFLLLIMISCKEGERIDYIPNGKGAPQQVSNIVITPKSGGAVVRYDVPKDDSFFYAKAVYETKPGVKRETKASLYTDSLVLIGFGDTIQHEVKIYSVGKNEVESAPVIKNFKPLRSPVMNVFDTFRLEPTFGGVKIYYNNPDKADIIVELFLDTKNTPDSDIRDWDFVNAYYVNAENGEHALRGLDTTLANFAVSVRDPFGNISGLYESPIKPWFEQLIPKEGFRDLRLEGDAENYSTGRNVTQLWDDDWTWTGNFWATDQGVYPLPKWISIDAGVKCILSRLRWFQRRSYEWRDGRRPTEWEVYGSNTISPNWDNWTLIQKLGAEFKPSGLPEGQYTQEDIEWARNEGSSFDIENQQEAYRYYRIKILKTGGTENFVLLAELEFYGTIIK